MTAAPPTAESGPTGPPRTVPRETAQPAPGGADPRPSLTDAARDLLGPSIDVLVRYSELLAGAAVERGLLGPREAPRLWDRHLLNSAVVAPLIPDGSSVADIGSGAGLPGIVLALVRPDLEVTLVEPLLRRVTFLQEVVDSLAIPNARVVRVRAEERSAEVVSGRVAPVDVVTARAVAPLGRLGTWCLPLLRDGGQLLALKGAGAESELAAATGELRAAGARSWELVEVGSGIVDPPTRVVRVTAGAPSRRGRRRTR